MRFQYTAKNLQGQVVTDYIEADNQKEVVNLLRKQDLMILKLSEVRGATKKAGTLNFFSKKIKPDDLVLFTRQLSTMVSAGLPLLQGLLTLKEQVTNPSLANVITSVVEQIEAGSSFSEAIEKHPKVFNSLFLNMTRAGEASGQLPQILDRVAVYLEEMAALRKRIKSAMMYPIIVSIMALSVTLVLLLKVIPVFKGIYADFGGELPVATQVLIHISEYLNQWIGVFVVLVVALIVGLKMFYKTDKGHYLLDKLKLKLPIVGILSLKISLSRFSKTFSTLIQSGVPILSALNVVSAAAGNRVIETIVMKAAQRIKEGESITTPLSQSRFFPPMVIKMIAVGEKTGQLDLMLSKVADFYDEEVKATVAGLTSIIEPLLIGFLGIVVGGIVISMFLPIFKLSVIITG